MAGIIAYDLDGVLQPDIVFNSKVFDRVHHVRSCYLFPLIQPIPPYAIITGRPSVDKMLTEQWISTFLDAPPTYLFHDNKSLTKPWLYKIKMLREHPDITTYVESSASEVVKIKRALPELRVLHFSTIVNAKLIEAHNGK